MCVALEMRKKLSFQFISQEKRLQKLFDDVTRFSPEPDDECQGSSGAILRRGTSEITECCICLDRKPDVILPCTHVYCSQCIEQW